MTPEELREHLRHIARCLELMDVTRDAIHQAILSGTFDEQRDLVHELGKTISATSKAVNDLIGKVTA